ncbi:hypothetical protein [Cupriavidus sp. USMAA2-4]|uniref:hypothetical protein n=1 Tax=Cupriavidus sp. USMAA2-4 TaxID=876364 RepID=UPI0012F4E158|nr:hypothetical protein [Cupriavidus sp. USMAA2-4]
MAALGKTPGSAGRIYEKATEQQGGSGRKVESFANALSRIARPSVSGRTIEKGVTGEGGFVSRFKEGQKSLYDKLDTFIPADKAIDVSSTRGALASTNQDIKGAESLSKWFQKAKIKGIEEALKKACCRPGWWRHDPAFDDFRPSRRTLAYQRTSSTTPKPTG